jgi:ribonucleoside-diphosphate reductase alpha chain
MRVLKRNGKEETFNDKKIHKRVERACKGIENVDPKTIVYNSTLKLYDGVKTEEIDEALIKSSRALIEQQPEYSLVAARILLNSLYKEVFGESVDSDAVQYQYKRAFVTNVKKLVKQGVLAKEMLKFDLKRLAEHIDIKRDELFEYAGLQTIVDRYLIKLDNEIVESPQALWMRIAMGLAIGEQPENRTEYAIQFYEVLSEMLYVPSTPTLFYSGTSRSQLSSCFLNTFEDSVFGIFDGLHQEAQKSKFAGGLGMDFTPFRAGNALINSTGGKTTGAVYTWKLFNDMLVSINQGGKRRGAGCGYLETWHYDIEDFLELKKNTGDERKRCHDLNTANWIPDLFMKQVQANGSWYLFSPEEVPNLHSAYGEEFEKLYWEYVEKGKKGEIRLFREVNAKDLWKKMLKMLFETGGPWCVHGTTLVPVIHDGIYKDMAIIEIAERFSNNELICALSFDTETQKEEYQPIVAAAMMRMQSEIYEIEDECGNILCCTGDHLIFTQNRGYVKVKDLVSTDILVKKTDV